VSPARTHRCIQKKSLNDLRSLPCRVVRKVILVEGLIASVYRSNEILTLAKISRTVVSFRIGSFEAGKALAIAPAGVSSMNRIFRKCRLQTVRLILARVKDFVAAINTCYESFYKDYFSDDTAREAPKVIERFLAEYIDACVRATQEQRLGRVLEK